MKEPVIYITNPQIISNQPTLGSQRETRGYSSSTHQASTSRSGYEAFQELLIKASFRMTGETLLNGRPFNQHPLRKYYGVDRKKKKVQDISINQSISLSILDQIFFFYPCRLFTCSSMAGGDQQYLNNIRVSTGKCMHRKKSIRN